MITSQQGDKEIIKLLLAAGANVDEKNTGGQTALMFASAHDHLEVVKLLLAAGADVNAKKKYDVTALMVGVSKNSNLEIV